MIIKVFAVYDSKACMFQAPFFMPAVGAAVRAFADAVNSEGHMFSKHAGDYVLYQIADFDDNSGEFKNVAPALHLGVGTEFVSVRNGFDRGFVNEKSAVMVANGREDDNGKEE